ncbi:hypothetical protein Mgra_00002107 [Meloidogyne graminicola]|uniref:Uncharacterized protein n=1 Tax=Meloidogyne graminicola TaxID=189291 RepID=A0A8S9ZZ77_9BILA|nr:hypothetical protein Mgra_00002107 [Meloidogyne graminicola]
MYKWNNNGFKLFLKFNNKYYYSFLLFFPFIIQIIVYAQQQQTENWEQQRRLILEGGKTTIKSSSNLEDNNNGDLLYILLDEISVFSCKGIKNEIKLTEEDVQIINEKGNKVYYIKAPGNYSLHFKNINVLNNLAYLSGEIGVTLQVPILEGPAGIRFDVPYTMIPETGLLDQQCDEASGIVQREKRQYCRYCELCTLTDKIEKGLTNGEHQFLPILTSGQEQPFSPICSKIGAKNYEFKRTINLPGRFDLENKIKQKMNGVDAEIRKRLNKGRGRFQVFLNLISADAPPITMKDWFDGSEQCKCCGREKEPTCRGVLSFLYCNIEDCKSAYAQQCLHNSAHIVACYTVEFNYRMSTRKEEVQQFLRENNYPDQDLTVTTSLAADEQTISEIPNQNIRTDVVNNNQRVNNQHQKEIPRRLVYGDEQRSKQPKELSIKCVSQMATRLTHLRRYCNIFWNEKLCCSHCPGIC